MGRFRNAGRGARQMRNIPIGENGDLLYRLHHPPQYEGLPGRRLYRNRLQGAEILIKKAKQERGFPYLNVGHALFYMYHSESSPILMIFFFLLFAI